MTTQPNTELREAIVEIILNDSNLSIDSARLDELVALFQAREQQLLTELLKYKSVITLRDYGGNNREELEIISVEIVEAMMDKSLTLPVNEFWKRPQTPRQAEQVAAAKKRIATKNKTNDGGRDGGL